MLSFMPLPAAKTCSASWHESTPRFPRSRPSSLSRNDLTSSNIRSHIAHEWEAANAPSCSVCVRRSNGRHATTVTHDFSNGISIPSKAVLAWTEAGIILQINRFIQTLHPFVVSRRTQRRTRPGSRSLSDGAPALIIYRHASIIRHF